MKYFKPSQYQLDMIKNMRAKDKARVIVCNGRYGGKTARHKALEEALGIKVRAIKPKIEPLTPDDLRANYIKSYIHYG